MLLEKFCFCRKHNWAASCSTVTIMLQLKKKYCVLPSSHITQITPLCVWTAPTVTASLGGCLTVKLFLARCDSKHYSYGSLQLLPLFFFFLQFCWAAIFFVKKKQTLKAEWCVTLALFFSSRRSFILRYYLPLTKLPSSDSDDEVLKKKKKKGKKNCYCVGLDSSFTANVHPAERDTVWRDLLSVEFLELKNKSARAQRETGVQLKLCLHAPRLSSSLSTFRLAYWS